MVATPVRRRSGHNKTVWTPEMVDALIGARSQRLNYVECADIVGVDTKVAGKKCRELGINGRFNRGWVKGKDNK